MPRRGLWFFLMIAIVLGVILWTSGGSRVLAYVPYYWKWVLGETATVTVGDNVFHVEVASTPDQQHTGLSHRSYLPADKGMLFVFNQPGAYVFTMQETEITLDIVWINDGRIVYVKSKAMPGEEYISPPGPATDVLEVRGGAASGPGWQVGDTVDITFDRSADE